MKIKRLSGGPKTERNGEIEKEREREILKVVTLEKSKKGRKLERFTDTDLRVRDSKGEGRERETNRRTDRQTDNRTRE